MDYHDLKFPNGSVFLVTGGAGFVGSNLCEAVLEMGYYVRCLDNLSNGFLRNIEPFLQHPKFTFIKGDIAHYKTCLQVTQGVDYVLHNAAWGSVPRSIEMPLLYEQNNVVGTLNMMEASKQNWVKKFVYASSSSVYGDELNLPKKEGQEGNLLSPYALTKATNEEYGKLYYSLYDLETYGLRYFNVFGKRQNSDGAYAAVIPKWIKQLLHNEIPIIYGDGNQSRDFTYIENVVEANLKACLASSDVAGQTYNIAHGGREYLIDIYWTLAKSLEKDIQPIFAQERTGDIRHSHADTTKARHLLGYEGKWSFEMGIKEAIKWYIADTSI